ncbi:MAG: hypothetical protein P4L50_15205 [Anaerolineaceae bacterium]|nr:hypothetical protein [Anaerolineaceae bacterium]
MAVVTKEATFVCLCSFDKPGILAILTKKPQPQQINLDRQRKLAPMIPYLDRENWRQYFKRLDEHQD